MTHQFDLLDYLDQYPYAPAPGKTDTSHAAAEIVRPNAATIRAAVLAEIRRAPGTYHQISERLGIDSRTVQPRISELRAQSLVRDSGRRVKTDGHASAAVWEAAP
jgi:predicted transcriptional regulator